MLLHLPKPIHLYGDDDSDLTKPRRAPKFLSGHLFRDFAEPKSDRKPNTHRGKDKSNGRRRRKRGQEEVQEG